MKKLLKKIKFIFAILLGYKYITNNRTKEIHLLSLNHKRFNLLNLTDYDFVYSERDLDDFYDNYDGCKYCLPERHIK